MKPLFQLSTRKYDEELPLVEKAMEELEDNCKIKDGYDIKEPFAKAGWTFFNLELSAEMASVIENSGMMENAGGGGWESNGVYTLKGKQGDLQNEFEFNFSM